MTWLNLEVFNPIHVYCDTVTWLVLELTAGFEEAEVMQGGREGCGKLMLLELAMLSNDWKVGAMIIGFKIKKKKKSLKSGGAGVMSKYLVRRDDSAEGNSNMREGGRLWVMLRGNSGGNLSSEANLSLTEGNLWANWNSSTPSMGSPCIDGRSRST